MVNCSELAFGFFPYSVWKSSISNRILVSSAVVEPPEVLASATFAFMSLPPMSKTPAVSTNANTHQQHRKFRECGKSPSLSVTALSHNPTSQKQLPDCFQNLLFRSCTRYASARVGFSLAAASAALRPPRRPFVVKGDGCRLSRLFLPRREKSPSRAGCRFGCPSSASPPVRGEGGRGKSSLRNVSRRTAL